MNPANYSVISFPALGISLNPPRGFSVGPLYIHFYGLIIACGLMLAVYYACKRSRQAGLDEDTLLDGVLWVTPFTILCARAYYCAFSWSLYKNNPISVLYIWEGGLAIYGGVLGAAIGVALFCKIKKCSLPALLDLVSLGFLIGQSMGCWGNFFNREAFGDYTNSLFAMAIPTDYYVGKGTLTGMINSGIITSEMANHMQVYDGMQWITVHPTFLYESVWNLILLIVIFIYRKHKKFDGEIFLMYLWGYGLGRVWIEGLRSDSLMLPFFNMKVSQMIAAICVLACSVLIVKKRMDTVKKQAPAGKKEQ